MRHAPVTFGLLGGLLLAAGIPAGCGDDSPAQTDTPGDGGADADADVPADVPDELPGEAEADGGTEADADAPGEAEADADADPDCVWDDTTELTSYCHGAVVDLSRDVPGGGNRVRYAFDVTRPEGDYDLRCVRLDAVTVYRGETVIRTAEAEPTGSHLWQVVVEAEANAEELAACAGTERVEVFGIEYHGVTPLGAFRGSCNRSGGWRWPPEVTLACHTGVEASLGRTDGHRMLTPMQLTSVDMMGGFGNHSAVPLTGFTLGAPTWRALDGGGEEYAMDRPPWELSGPWWDRPPWEDRVEPGGWGWVNLQWSGLEAPVPDRFCPPYDDTMPAIPPPTQVVMPGSHSAGAFVVESHPVYCLTYP
ncbi:MAG: hypothetical protein JXB32_10845 [Deltaproteobacteria bacterium]|nr:hypothetical protein [Deltaproteobacteria bacterium]